MADPNLRPGADAIRPAFLAGVAVVAFLAGLTGIREFDVFHHLAVGRQVLGAGFSGGDPFLFTGVAEAAGVPAYWLGSLALWAAHAIGGFPGLVVLVALAGAATFSLVAQRVLEEPGGEADALGVALAFIPIALALGAWRVRAVARPEVVGLAFFAWALLALRRAEAGRGRAILFFPLVAAAWSNVHVSVVFGVAAVSVEAAGAFLERGSSRPGNAPRSSWTRLALVALLGAAATLLNPGGSPLVLAARFGFGLLGLGTAPGGSGSTDQGLEAAQSRIVELLPPGWDALPTPLGALVVVGLLSFLAARRRPRFTDAVLLLGFTLLGARAVRFVPWGAVAWAAVAGSNLVAAGRRWRERRHPGRVARSAATAAALLLGAASVAWSFAYLRLPFGVALEERLFPLRATEVLEEARAGARGVRLYDWVGAGGWLEWRLPGARLYQDGRLLWPPGEAAAAMAGTSDRPAFDWLDRRWRFDALVLRWPEAADAVRLTARQDPAADRATWALVAFDDGGLLYVRRDGRLAELATQEYRFVLPAVAPTLSELDDPSWRAGFRREAERARAERPGCDVCRALAWLGAEADGDDAAAGAILPGGRLPEPADPFGHGGLEVVEAAAVELGRSRYEAGQAAAAAGDPALAATDYRRSLAAFESASGPHLQLGLLMLAAGDRPAAERHLARAVQLEPALRGQVQRALAAAP